MAKKDNAESDRDLAKEQADLLSLMEASMSPETLAAVQQAYSAGDEKPALPSMKISAEGTSYA